MNKKCYLLAVMLAVSGVLVCVAGAVIKFAILAPRGLYQDRTAVALPFLLMRDEGLQYLLSNPLPAPPVAPEPHVPAQTQPPDTEPAPTDPPPTEPTDPTEQETDILERILFIGDSRTCGLRDHARLEGAEYFCDVGMSVFNIGKKNLSDSSFSNLTLSELLASREYTCITINLGLNESGYPIQSLMSAYQELVTQLVQTQPQAVIVLQGILTVGRSWEKTAPYASPKNLGDINERIRSISDEYRIFYIEANETFGDDAGYLPDTMTWDGCHLYAKDTDLWNQWICNEIRSINR